MTIKSNGSKRAGESPDSVDVLLDLLKREPLDRVFERYGNFATIDCDDAYLWGNFLRVSHVFDIRGTVKECRALIEAIRRNQARADYREQAAP